VNQLAALQAALRTEFEVIYGYGVVGAHLSGKPEDYASARLISHLQRRDKLAGMITALGATPAVSHAAYQLPYAVTGASTARRLAAHLELGAANAAWDLAAATSTRSAGRTYAVSWISDAAFSAALWGGTQALPGQPV
jgi:hypothetical protein